VKLNLICDSDFTLAIKICEMTSFVLLEERQQLLRRLQAINHELQDHSLDAYFRNTLPTLPPKGDLQSLHEAYKIEKEDAARGDDIAMGTQSESKELDQLIPNTQIRISQRKTSNSQISQLTAQKLPTHLSNITNLSNTHTFATIVSKSAQRQHTETNKKYSIFRISDMKGTYANLILLQAVNDKWSKVKVGEVVLLIQPLVLQVSNKYQLIAD
jgi:hypothetical protein